MAETTPPTRNRVVDLIRVVSILVVVFGHWLMAAITFEDGQLRPGHLLELADWTHPLTWVFQVMPLFFFVGGYSNALSWRSARDRGETYGSWLRDRLRRLALPVVPLLLVWTFGGWLGLRLGLDWEMLQLASCSPTESHTVGATTMRIGPILGLVAALIAFLIWRARRTPDPEALWVARFDEETVSVTTPDPSLQSIRWDEITRVQIRTTDEGPWAPDVFWGLHRAEGDPVIVLNGATGLRSLIEEMERRLPGFRDESRHDADDQ